MGGEFAPHAALQAASTFNNLHFVFVGDLACAQLVKEYRIKHYTFVESYYILEEGEKVGNSDLARSSMYIALMQVKNGAADFVVSAGPSGYYLLLARRLLGTLANLARPAIAAIIPTAKRSAIMMDLGANLTCTAHDLVQFAIMGRVLSKFWLNTITPRVGFINVGSELGKGPEYIRNAALIYEKINPESFAGMIECNYIMQGTHDVIIADGLLGNCVLKLGEGMMVFFKDKMKKLFSKNIFYYLLGILLKKELKTALIDPKKFNGGIFAGINGCVIKSHGSSDALAFRSAVAFGMEVSRNREELFNTIALELEKSSVEINALKTE